MGPLTTPKKVGDSMSMDACDPWTPTSNLKILISAASPDIRNREKELCKDSDVQDSADLSQVCVFVCVRVCVVVAVDGPVTICQLIVHSGLLAKGTSL